MSRVANKPVSPIEDPSTPRLWMGPVHKKICKNFDCLDFIMAPYHCYERLYEGEYQSSRAQDSMWVIHDESLKIHN